MQVSFEAKAEKEFLKLDKAIQVQILKFIKRLSTMDNPRDAGKPLVGNLKDYWRYRAIGLSLNF